MILPEILTEVGPQLFRILQNDDIVNSSLCEPIVMECMQLILELSLMNENLVDIAVVALFRVAVQTESMDLRFTARECLVTIATECQQKFKSRVQTLPALAQDELKKVLLAQS
eukprot:CAMPEP_0204834356 /NCGR_PEP_ID=MMETSP1346-20131115/19646_1 /ASSEMBLY_ACC=CAM_ASM_000771 /TAXON_ID=215587 /ORGANISM="Aplanochytrium stocchinoi, Strain GSBS06" /LENGTH=112 /DNA_ID=CAMNT_0051967643 /DNA_START=131 /DNA_END=469 /DNA_ORIENTATION=+